MSGIEGEVGRAVAGELIKEAVKGSRIGAFIKKKWRQLTGKVSGVAVLGLSGAGKTVLTHYLSGKPVFGSGPNPIHVTSRCP